jgi:glycosyltransferase involved in cell wall biosynthesis
MAKFAAVHQFHSGTAVGDAVTGDMLEIQRALRSAGFHSEIFAEHVAAGLKDRIHLLSSYAGSSSSLLVAHHSMGFDCLEQVLALPDRKILKYHNITPAEYLPNQFLRAYAQKGRAQLRAYREHVELAVGDSEFNRRELIDIGYRYTDVLPIFFRPGSLLDETPDKSILRRLNNKFNLLCVGRICTNKKQAELVRIFDTYRRFNPDARLLLVGTWKGDEDYAEEVRSDISRRKLDDAVSLTGKVSAAELAAYYRSGSVLVCASEHEGFCVPLLEAMSFDLPVIAYAEAAVPETLGDAGILLDSKQPELWCEAIEELRRNHQFRAEVLKKQRQRLAEMGLERTQSKLLEIVNGLAQGSPIRVSKPTLQIQGPFETSYSLALVNRHLALAMDQIGDFDVSIHCTEGPGDYTPKEADLADKPAAKWLWQKSKMLSERPHVVIRNLYPPRVHDVPGKLNLLYSYWEDSLLPSDWVRDFNRHIDAVLAPSRHVERVMRDSGVKVPVRFVGAGVEERFFRPRAAAPRESWRSFTFLHISSGFPRKGVDILLQAYFTEFSSADNVRLVIKTFPNVHNDVGDQIAAWRGKTPNPPKCAHIDRDIPPEEIDQLYDGADCLVYPSRAEGFGLPIAEAMAQKLPVIVTGYSGHMDFCSKETAFILGYDLVPSQSHLAVPGAKWAEPRVDDLRARMRCVYENRNSEEVRRRVEAAYENISTNFRWSRVARRVGRVVDAESPRLAMVTSWDARCGIAEYSRYLIETLQNKYPRMEIEVLSSPGEGLWPGYPVRHEVCWHSRPQTELGHLRSRILSNRFDVVHFQFNFGFFDLYELAFTIAELKRAGVRVVITFHSTADLWENDSKGKRLVSLREIAGPLRTADLLTVHSAADQQQLAAFGVSDNVRLLPHGNVAFPPEERSLRKAWGITFDPVISTFGFLLPHKGIIELLQAVKILLAEFPCLGLLAQAALHRDPTSQQFEAEVRKTIERLGLGSCVLLSTDFVAPEEAALFLQLSDAVVLPYKKTAESASGAVRFALATGRPVITTGAAIFGDVAESTFQVGSNDPEELAIAIRTVLTDHALSNDLAEKARQQVAATSWGRVAEDYMAFLQSLLTSNR